ncbi:MAG: copper chaperone [Myxococcota bacterium]|jgi:copper chaperone
MSTKTTTYGVDGMTCGGCVGSLTRALETALPGHEVNVQLEGGQIQIGGDHDPAQVARAVADAGFELRPETDPSRG